LISSLEDSFSIHQYIIIQEATSSTLRTINLSREQHITSTFPYNTTTTNHLHNETSIQHYNGVHQEQRSKGLGRRRPPRQGASPICQRRSHRPLPSTSIDVSSWCPKEYLLDIIDSTIFL
jgi:hypothetical protein